MPKKLSTRNAVVIGGTSNIGEAVVLHLLRRGLKVIFTGRRKDFHLRARKDFSLDNICYVPLVIEEKLDFNLVAKKINEIFNGKLHVLVYIAGPALFKSLEKTEIQEFEYLVKVNLLGFFACYKFLKPYIVRGEQSRIVVFASAGAENLSAKKLFPAYFSAKTALLSLVRSLSVEISPEKITVNAICPGWLDSDDEFTRTIVSKIPAGRLGKKEDILHALDYILAPGSEYITGNFITVSGGYGV